MKEGAAGKKTDPPVKMSLCCRRQTAFQRATGLLQGQHGKREAGNLKELLITSRLADWWDLGDLLDVLLEKKAIVGAAKWVFRGLWKSREKTFKKRKKEWKKVLTNVEVYVIIIRRSRERPLRKRSKALDDRAQDWIENGHKHFVN